jgi:hypothetical protein
MSYLNAPATGMLATYCACCSQPLLDAKSVELGIGPVCRKKHGFDLDVPEEARLAANKLVHEIACLQDDPDVRGRVVALSLLGFAKLADRIAKRVGCVRIEAAPGEYHVRAPYNEAHVAAMRQVPGRRFFKDGKDRYDRVPATSRAALWGALKGVWAGKLGSGPKGFFVFGEGQ